MVQIVYLVDWSPHAFDTSMTVAVCDSFAAAEKAVEAHKKAVAEHDDLAVDGFTFDCSPEDWSIHEQRLLTEKSHIEYKIR